jgi:integrase
MRERLTGRTIDALPATGRDYIVWDKGQPGFGVRILASGERSWLVQVKVGGRGGRTYRKSLGSCRRLTLSEARARARRLLGAVEAGGDPAAAWDDTPKTETVGGLADLYLKEGPAEKPNKRPSSWAIDRSNIERHIKPLLGTRQVISLTQADVARFQADVAAGKTRRDEKTGVRGRAIVKGGRGTAARSLAVLGAILQFGVGRELLPSNPARGVALLRGEKKERFLSEREVAKIADALRNMESEGAINPHAASAIRLLLLTGCRKSEILTLRWEYIDFHRACFRLPRSKTGAKVVPLAAAALETLSELPHTSEWVIPASTGMGPLLGLQKIWSKLRLRASLPGVRLHDLRHSFASFAVADGQSLFMVGKILGHQQTKTTEVYAHLAADPIRAAVDRTAARIAAAMREPKEMGEVSQKREQHDGTR